MVSFATVVLAPELVQILPRHRLALFQNIDGLFHDADVVIAFAKGPLEVDVIVCEAATDRQVRRVPMDSIAEAVLRSTQELPHPLVLANPHVCFPGSPKKPGNRRSAIRW